MKVTRKEVEQTFRSAFKALYESKKDKLQIEVAKQLEAYEQRFEDNLKKELDDAFGKQHINNID